MQVSLVNIGTRKGIRIPSVILKEFNNPHFFDLKVENHKIVLDEIKNTRDGWKNKFKNSKNDLLIDDSLEIEKLDAV